MLNAVYRLVAPRRFEVEFTEIELRNVIVRPTHLSICRADQRYYQGTRPAEVLAQKLPMALIHEGIGQVVYDETGEYQPGQRVVMIPNTPTEPDSVIAENYLRSSRFRASGFDGFMQDYVELGRDRLVCLPSDIDLRVAAFTELITVSVHAISRFDRIAHERRRKIGIWGDGNLGYITALLFHTMFPEVKLFIFGVDENKLADFAFAEETILVKDIPKDLEVDHAFECVGGNGAQMAIDQMIDNIAPEGTMSLLGVSENHVPINTRMVLEKGLRLFGSSRSGREDFQQTVSLFEKNRELVGNLQNLIGSVIEVGSISDMKEAFETDIRRAFGKTVMVWKN